MAGTVTPNLTDISLCELTSGWTSLGGTLAQNDPALFDAIQGSYCCQVYGASGSDRGAQWDFGSGTEVDFSATTKNMIIFWFAFSKKSFSTNPLRIRMTDGAGNWSEWNMFTASSLPHPAWIAWALKPTVTPDDSSGTLDLANVRYVSWRVAAGGSKVYFYWDAVRYGTGLSIKAGTSGAPAVLEDFVTAEATNAYGVVEKANGIYYIQGQITIGSLTPDESTYFEDTNQVIQFKSMKGNPTGFYEIKGQNATSGSGTTSIFFGEKSGSAGISGCFIRAPSAMKWKLTISDTNITEFGFYGCTLVYADTITGQAYSTSKEFLGTNFVACAEMLPNTGIVKECKFISSPNEAIRMTSVSHNITYCDFITCSRGVHIPNAETYSFNALSFSGCTYDVKNSSVGLVTVNYDQYCSPPPSTYEETGGGSTTIQTSVSIVVRHVKTGSEPAEYVRCSVHKKSDSTEIMNADATVADEQSTGYYKASTTYTQTGIAVIVRAREKGYLPFEIEVTIPAAGLDVTAVWITDPNYQV